MPSGKELMEMKIKATWLDYLTMIAGESKDAQDPTYLMQAFGITEKTAKFAIAAWLLTTKNAIQ